MNNHEDHLGSSTGTAENLAECPNCYDGGQCDKCASMECALPLSKPNAALRDYFAARAPELPSWFTRQSSLKVIELGNGMRGPRHVEETLEEQFFRWRWHYADSMLRTR